MVNPSATFTFRLRDPDTLAGVILESSARANPRAFFLVIPHCSRF